MRTCRTALCVACLVVGACSSETVGPPPRVPVNWRSLEVQPVADAGGDILTAKERALPDAYAAALAAPGFAGLSPLLDEDAHFGSPGMDDAHGRDAVVRAHDALVGAFDDRKVALTRILRTPNVQTIEWTLAGTQARDWMGVPTAHRSVIFRGLTLLWTNNNGAVTDVHVFVDVAVVKAQLGVGPKDLLALAAPAMPAQAPQAFEQSGSAEEKNNVAVVRAALDAMENKNEARYLDTMTDDLEVDSFERPQPARGKSEAKAYYRALHKAIGQLDVTVENALGVAQFAVVEYSIAGEQIGPIGWIPAQSNKVIRFELADVCEVRGGRIARVWRYDNPLQVTAGAPR